MVALALQAEKFSMEHQLENLTAQLESMRAKNNTAASQNSTLEKAIIFRDREISQLQERSHVSCAQCFTRQTDPLPDARHIHKAQVGALRILCILVVKLADALAGNGHCLHSSP